MTIPLDSAAKLLGLLASGELTARQATQASLDRIAATDPEVGAFTFVNTEAALAAADSIDQRRRDGQPLGALAGVPIAVKDVLCTTDMPTTCSSRMLENHMSPYDATVVARLRAADAVIVGKTNMDEFAMGASTETSAFGKTTNPWNPSLTPGGSSGGAAACVAAGDVPLSLGSDTGGSIRQPAAFCGITGLKPTYGRVSRYGLIAFASSLDQVGPMAFDAVDCATLLNAIAGVDASDSTSLPVETPDFTAGLDRIEGELRIGIVKHHLEAEGLDPEVRQAVDDAIEVFRDAGAKIVEVELPHSDYWVPTYYVIAPSEASSNLSRYDGAHYGHRSPVAASDAGDRGPLVATYCRSRGEAFGAEVKRRIMIGMYALSAGYGDKYYVKALQVRRLIRQDFDSAFQNVDLLLGPVTPTPPFAMGEKIDDPLQMYLCDLFTVGANLAGIPALSMPGGLTSNNLPIGIQLQAPPLQEAKLLQAAAAFQRATDWHTKRPL
ncbi:Asp-tRNA(Asn)/Glu-tRNA(Gln) amidotransferase subunit GatA [Rosistilla oblonga]|uniref:Glutamyl-tRNA(Gln) amidotransferase subunit A n=1 Tax=Rosistilla oblonga TaxID=2527990 RepID=A0A518IMU8_9BACT|nr:Asp-tRNA(Asn)/Glu-tRNA(Gln) amidotransferase subunit GatA [Rosistilla oblonga]QDV54412.1 Glutamyl-tRNA(Gln) amidotransferase subunit A [Rosistilla oblonga]